MAYTAYVFYPLNPKGRSAVPTRVSREEAKALDATGDYEVEEIDVEASCRTAAYALTLEALREGYEPGYAYVCIA